MDCCFDFCEALETGWLLLGAIERCGGLVFAGAAGERVAELLDAFAIHGVTIYATSSSSSNDVPDAMKFNCECLLRLEQAIFFICAPDNNQSRS